MKRTILAFVILFVLAGQTVCYAGDKEDQYKTKGLHNGRQWLGISEREKQAYIAGIYDGAALLLEAMDEQKICNSNNCVKIFNSTLITNIKPKEIAPQIDSFYTDSSNLNIPIYKAYEMAGYKFRGESPSKIEEYTAQLRKVYNK